MRRIVYTAFLFLLCGQWAWSDNVAETYFNGYKDALTAVWNNPFSYESIRSKDAPRGPYMGNGDVGVIAYASANSQTLRFSKVNFVTDGVADWAGTGPAALPVAEVSMGVDAPVGDDFRFEMCQPTARFVMHTSTRPTVRMETWMSMSDNYVVTEVTNLSDSPVSAWVETHGLPSPIYSSDVAVDDDVACVVRTTRQDGDVRWVSRAGVSSRVIGAENTLQITSDSVAKALCKFELKARATVYVAICVTGGGTDKNIVLKENGLSIGWIANAEAGMGTKDKKLGRLFALRFTPQSRLSFFANMNNLNDDRKPGNNGDWNPLQQAVGEKTSCSGGLDYNVIEKRGAYRVNGNIVAKYIEDDVKSIIDRENFLSGGNTYGKSFYNSKKYNSNIETNHSFQYLKKVDMRLLEMNYLNLSPTFSYSNSRSHSESAGVTLSEDANRILGSEWKEKLLDLNSSEELLTYGLNRT
ncbi:MAG: hypothetical protein ACI4TR_06055, partial [Bacteroidaceae bacterium]